MPSSTHEALIELFRQRPSLAAELLGDTLGVACPEFQHARVERGDHADLRPTEYRADTVVVLPAADAAVFAVVVEVQLNRDQDKRWSWPVYLATLRARLRCPTALLVVCVNAQIAAWCAEPIEFGHPGTRLAPVVLGPAQVPVVTDPEQAESAPELSVLSALAHGSDPDHTAVLDALHGALAHVDPELAHLYSDLVLAALPAAARRHLEDLMIIPGYEPQSDFARRYYFQGKAEGRAEAVLAVLDNRGVSVPPETRARILACTDLAQLDTWLSRAATARSADDLLDR